jgi:hypothetical protein
MAVALLRRGKIIMELVTVFRSLEPEQAELVRSRLEAEGFNATIANENSNLTLSYGKGGGSLVQVPEDEAEEAKAVVESKE